MKKLYLITRIMVIEKLKEWEDKKDELEDEQILSRIDTSIKKYIEQIDQLEMEIDRLETLLIDMYHQYFLIKWEHHPLEHND